MDGTIGMTTITAITTTGTMDPGITHGDHLLKEDHLPKMLHHPWRMLGLSAPLPIWHALVSSMVREHPLVESWHPPSEKKMACVQVEEAVHAAMQQLGPQLCA